MMSRFDGTNTKGIFRLIFQRTMFYVVTDRNKQVSYPPLGEKWKEGVLEVAKNVFILQTTRSSATISSDLPLREPPAPSKRQKTGDINDDAASSVATAPCALNMSLDATSTEAGAVNTSGTTSTTTNSTSQEVLSRNSQSVSSYWNSLDACNLFGLKVNEPLDANVGYDMLKLRVELLQSANSSESGWRNVIEGGDPDNLCTPSDVFAVRGRSMILCLAYQLAIQNMNQWTWEQCCTQACSQLNSLGIQQATHHRTVQDWNGIFRHHGRFPHPNHAVRCGKQPLPLLFEKYPVAMNEIIQFGVKSLTTLTVESVHGFCHDTLIPKLFEQWRSDIEHSSGSRNRDEDPAVLTKEMFMNEHKISTLSIPTCWGWMHRLGFTYNTQRKGYYVDGHKRSDVVASRRAFCETYLTDDEPRCLRWTHVSQHELTTTHAILNPEFGYSFVDSLGESQVEFHVDYCASHATKENELLVGKIPRISI